MILFLIFVIGMLAAYLVTKIMRTYALRSSLIDRPNDRSLHSMPTPRGGGVGIVVGTLVASATGMILKSSLERSIVIAFFFAAMISVIGFLDDRYSLSAKLRLIFQLILSAGLIFVLMPLGLNFLVPAIALVLTITWMTNLYNFMDGSDGLAAVQGLTTALAASVLTSGTYLSPVFIALAGASLGFLFLNWRPAKIFMGDVGSLFLGFFSSGLLVIGYVEGSLSLVAGLILHGAFIVDASVTLATRLLRGKKPHVAHRSHAYQRWIQEDKSHQFVAVSYGSLNLLWLLPCAFIANENSNLSMQLGMLILAWVPIGVIVIKSRAGFDLV